MVVNMRGVTKEYRLFHWAKVIQERQESGQNIKSYCASAGLHPNTYYYWQRKVREASYQELASKPQSKTNVASRNGLPVPSGWALCEAEKVSKDSKTLTIEIGGCRVLADADVDTELLLKVCRVLVSL